MLYEFNKVTGALASCNHQKSKLRAVAGAELCWVAELRVRQLKIGSKSCFGGFHNPFGLAYSPLNSATLSCLSEVPLM